MYCGTLVRWSHYGGKLITRFTLINRLPLVLVCQSLHFFHKWSFQVIGSVALISFLILLPSLCLLVYRILLSQHYLQITHTMPYAQLVNCRMIAGGIKIATSSIHISVVCFKYLHYVLESCLHSISVRNLNNIKKFKVK